MGLCTRAEAALHAADPYPIRLVLLLLSGFAALTYELVWTRRLALVLGSGAVAGTLVLAALFGALGVGALLARRLGSRHPGRAYGTLELAAAAWALCLPLGLPLLTPLLRLGLAGQAAATLVAVVPPGLALGATLPVLARGVAPAQVAGLYAANTAGAVLAVLAQPALLLPVVGVRGTELVGVVCGVSAAAWAWSLPAPPPAVPPTPRSPTAPPAAPANRATAALACAAAAGCAGMALEVAWMRLGALLLGPSIHALARVLAVFLAGIALGAAISRRPRHPGQPLAWMGLFALVGALLHAHAPLALARAWEHLGPTGLPWATAAVMTLVMGGAAVASGAVFAQAAREAALAWGPADGAARVVGVNTLCGVVGSAATGLWLLPAFGVQGVVTGVAVLAAGVGSALSRRWLPAVLALALAVLQPAWDGRLYAVGLYGRLTEFADLSPAAIRRFAHDGWELVSYEDGRTAAVAVGRSTRTGNLWLSINGKVDASTGDDMPTQLLSARIPARMADRRDRALVVGLASGVTAGALLDEGVGRLVVVELEPAVVRASRHFDAVSGAPLDDPRTELVVDDARALLQRTDERFDVIVSEPSNPWITGVSNLFTREYWALGRARLAPGGVFCQWVQLYGLAPAELRSLVRTFVDVFGEATLFVTVEGADALLVAGGDPTRAPVSPALDPVGLRRLAARAPLNTDDRPVVELAAPRSLLWQTGAANMALIEQSSR